MVAVVFVAPTLALLVAPLGTIRNLSVLAVAAVAGEDAAAMAAEARREPKVHERAEAVERADDSRRDEDLRLRPEVTLKFLWGCKRMLSNIGCDFF